MYIFLHKNIFINVKLRCRVGDVCLRHAIRFSLSYFFLMIDFLLKTLTPAVQIVDLICMDNLVVCAILDSLGETVRSQQTVSPHKACVHHSNIIYKFPVRNSEIIAI